MDKEVYVIWQSDIKDYGILGIAETEELAKEIAKKYQDSCYGPFFEKCKVFSEEDLQNEFSFLVKAVKSDYKSGNIIAEKVDEEISYDLVTKYSDGPWNDTKEYLRVVVKAKCMEEAIEKATKLFIKHEEN